MDKELCEKERERLASYGFCLEANMLLMQGINLLLLPSVYESCVCYVTLLFM